MAVDLSFLPDQPTVKKKRPDLSFLPDQPDQSGGEKSDLSFLPDQPKDVSLGEAGREPSILEKSRGMLSGVANKVAEFTRKAIPPVPVTPAQASNTARSQFRSLVENPFIGGPQENDINSLVQGLSKTYDMEDVSLQHASEQVRGAFKGAINKLIQTPIYVGQRQTLARDATTAVLMHMTGAESPQELENIKNTGLTTMEWASDMLPFSPKEFRDWSAFEGAGLALGVIGAPLIARLSKNPILSKDILRRAVMTPTKDLQEIVAKAVDTYDTAYLKGATKEQASRAAMDVYEAESKAAITRATQEIEAGLPEAVKGGSAISSATQNGVPVVEAKIEYPFVRAVKEHLGNIKRAVGGVGGAGKKSTGAIDTTGIFEAPLTRPSASGPVMTTAGNEFVGGQFPSLAESVRTMSPAIDTVAAKDAVQKATAAGIEAHLRGATPAEADAAAAQSFTQNIQGRAKTVNPPEQRAKPAEEPVSPAVEVRARQIYREAMAQRDIERTPLERFIIENGGIASYRPGISGKKAEAEEYRDIPLHLRGTTPYDEMLQNAVDANLLPPDASYGSLYRAIGNMKKRGPVPRLRDFYEQAQNELDHERASGVYPQAPDVPEMEPAPFETGPKYAPEAPTFYSQLQRTIEAKMPNSAPVEQVKGIIGGGAVKQDEIDWSGINDFLAGKKTVSKAELLDFLKSNEVQVKEVVKSDSKDLTENSDIESVDIRRDSNSNKIYDVKFNDGRVVHIRDAEAEDMAEAQRLAIQSRNRERVGGMTKFSLYQLPGGENYREVLLTLPEKPQTWKKAFEEHSAFVRSLVDKYGQRYWEKATQADREKELRLGRAADAEMAASKKNDPFKSTHFDEPNIIAHVRMNDRTTADGKKTLFIEEIQSDWMQAGRAKGFLQNLKKLPDGFDVVFKEKRAGKNTGGWFLKEPDGKETFLFAAEKSAEGARLGAIQQALIELNNKPGAVPDAPFKKTWHELALKRILRYAVDNGYDAIAWTTGEQQAERYDLSKQLSEVEATKIGPKSFNIIARNNVTRGGVGRKIVEQIFDSEELPDVVGKDLANKIIADGGGKYSGLDLKVGGEGMKGFYDQMISSFLNKYTKKWGGRVGETKITQSATHGGGWTVMADGQAAAGFRTREAAQRAIDEGRYIGQDVEIVDASKEIIDESKNINVHSLEITPAMRESVSQGQALFENQPDLFGGSTPAKSITAKPKPVPEGQQELFSGMAKPKFEVPKTAFKPERLQNQDMFPSQQAEMLAKTEEGSHQVTPSPTPRAIMESTIVSDLQDHGYLPVHKMRIESPEDTAAIFAHLKDQSVESFYSISLDENNNILGVEMVSMGTLNTTLVNPRDALKGAKLMGAKKVVVVHNHPSGDPTPSKEDLELTSKLSRAADSAGMELSHHVVIDDTKFGFIKAGDVKRADAFELRDLPEPAAMGERARLVKPMQGGKAKGAPIDSPEKAAEFIRNFHKNPGGVVAVAINTKNAPAGVWHLGADFPSQEEAVKILGNIAIRNNAAAFILSSDRMPEHTYVSGLSAEMERVWGVSILDVTSAKEGEPIRSALRDGLVREGENPYDQSNLPIHDFETMSRLNKKRGDILALKKKSGFTDDQFNSLKAGAAGKGNLSEMDDADLNRLISSMRAWEKAAKQANKKYDPETIRKKLGISDHQYKGLRERMFGQSQRPLTSEQKKSLVEAMNAYPRDVRNHAIVWDVAPPNGTPMDKKFATEVAGYRNLTKYQRLIPMTWRAFKLIDPTGYFKRITYDKVVGAVQEEMRIVESIRERLASVAGDIQPFSPEDARAMRWGEGSWGPEYLKEITDMDAEIRSIMKAGTVKSGDKTRALTPDDRRRLQKALDFIAREKKLAVKFNPADVTDKEKALAQYIRRQYDDLISWENQVRRASGKEEIPYRNNYFTHMFERNGLDELANMFQDEDTGVLSISTWTKPNAPFNPFSLPRTGALGYKFGALGVFDRYLNTAVKEALYRPVLQEIRRMVKHLPGRSGNYVDLWLNDMAGKTNFIDRALPLPEWVEKPLMIFNQRARNNFLVANLNFFFRNASNPAITFSETGPVHAAAGYAMMLTPHWRDFAWKHSNLLRSRKGIYRLGETMLDKAKEIASLPVVEYFNVGGAFLSGYHRGIGKGMSEADAIRYGDEVAAMTQADYQKHAVSPLLRSRLGKALLPLQTYSFNMLDHAYYDMIADPGKTKGERFMGFLYLMAAIGAINQLYKKMTGRNAYDVQSFSPSIPILREFVNSISGQKSLEPPAYKGVKTAGRLLKAWTDMDPGEREKDMAAAKKGLSDLFFMIAPPFGGAQLQRAFDGRLMPKNPNQDSASPGAGVRVSGSRKSAVRSYTIRAEDMRTTR